MTLLNEAEARKYLAKYSTATLRQVGLDRVVPNAREFSRQLNRLGRYVEGSVDAVIRKTCLDLYRAIVERTPADTGRARASWGISTSNQGDEASASFDESSRPRATRGKSETGKKMSRFSAMPISGRVVIYNNLVYIEPLEQGWSLQAPAGMVAVSLAEFNKHLRTNFERMTPR